MKRSHRFQIKKLKAKLLTIAALSFLSGLATSLTATFAWFTINDAASVDNLKISIRTTEEPTLSIGVWDDSINDINFEQEEYTSEDLETEKLEIDEVSGMFESSWRDASLEEKMSREFYPTFQAPYRGVGSKTSTRQITREEGKFVQREFYLKATRNCEVYLGQDTYVRPNEENNRKTAEEYEGVNVDDLNNVVNATRFSIFAANSDRDFYTIVNPGASRNTYYGGIMDLDCNGYYDYDSENKEIIYGEYDDGTIAYKEKDVTDEEDLPSNNVFRANHKDGVMMWDKENSTVQIKKEDSVTLEDITIYDNTYSIHHDPLVKLKEGEATRIVVSIYLEGRDLNMTNCIQMASFDISISFAALVK